VYKGGAGRRKARRRKGGKEDRERKVNVHSKGEEAGLGIGEGGFKIEKKKKTAAIKEKGEVECMERGGEGI